MLRLFLRTFETLKSALIFTRTFDLKLWRFSEIFHFPFTVEDVNLNTRVFLWPLDMEETIELTLKTLNTKKSMAEDKLRSRKTIFEDKLKKHERDLELFRRFDPPLLNLDLLRDVMEKVDGIFKNLLVSLLLNYFSFSSFLTLSILLCYKICVYDTIWET